MSGGYIWYHQRPNKTVERQMFIELLNKMNRYLPIGEYAYIGFGGPYLEDFKLMHSYFGTSNMISIEEDKNVFQRQLFNLPYAYIKTENCTSSDLITEKIDTNLPTIAWLDFAAADAHAQQIGELQQLLSKLGLNDIVKVTLNANPSTLFDGGQRKIVEGEIGHYTSEELAEKRFEKLSERLGEFMPSDVSAENMTRSEYPKLINRIIGISTGRIVSSINPNYRFQPLSSFVYGDSDNQMITVTGIIIEYEKIKEMIDVCGLQTWDFATLNWGVTNLIQLPSLTTKEKFSLDQKIPCQNIDDLSEMLDFKFDRNDRIHKSILESYIKYYRHYPSFHRINY